MPLPRGDGEDRLIFHHLKQMPHGFTGRASVYYALDPKDGMHLLRMQFIAKQQGAGAPLSPLAAKADSLR